MYLALPAEVVTRQLEVFMFRRKEPREEERTLFFPNLVSALNVLRQEGGTGNRRERFLIGLARRFSLRRT